MVLLTGSAFTIGSIVLFLWLPGAILSQFGTWHNNHTAADAFFVGWMWLLVVTILLSPFVHSTEALVLLVRGSVVTLTVFLSVVHRFRTGKFCNFLSGSFSKTNTLIKGGIVASVFLCLFSFFVTHNLGFDDVSNLQYLAGVQDGKVFPVYRTLVGNWEAARYPSFGTIYAVIFYGLPGGVFCTYYFLGSFVFAVLLVKIYEFVFHHKNDVLYAVTVVALCGAIFMFVGKDNYFNYGLYPFQQGKFLFIAGLLYIFSGWPHQRLKAEFVLGAGLLTAAWLHHFNLIILFCLIVPFLIFAVWITVPGFKKKLLFTMIVIAFPLVTSPAAVLPIHGLIHFKPPPKVISVVNTVKEVKEPSFWDRMNKRAYMVASWLKHGRQREVYFDRVVSYDILFIVLLVFLSNRMAWQRKNVCIAMLFLIFFSMLVQSMLTLPRQALITLYRSGPAAMVIDLMRSSNKWENGKRYQTDPYTGLYLKTLFGADTQVLSSLQEITLCTPMLTYRQDYSQREMEQQFSHDNLVCNGRLEGRLSYLNEKEMDRFQTGVVQSFEDLTQQNNYWKVPLLMKSIGGVFLQQLKAPVFMQKVHLKTNFSDTAVSQLKKETNNSEIRVWRNAATVFLNDVRRGERVTIRFRYRAESIRQLLVLSGTENFKKYIKVIETNKGPKRSRFDKGIRKEQFQLQFLKEAKKVFFVFDAEGFGHFGRLGMIESVLIERDGDNDSKGT